MWVFFLSLTAHSVLEPPPSCGEQGTTDLLDESGCEVTLRLLTTAPYNSTEIFLITVRVWCVELIMSEHPKQYFTLHLPEGSISAM